MLVLPREFVLPIRPADYLKQGPTHCGAFSVKAILSAFGLDTKQHPKEYHPHWFGRLSGLTLGINYWPGVLRSHGIAAEPQTAARLADREKIDLLKRHLVSGTPVMVRIGNGYFPGKRYNPLLGRLVVHWITVWGYDDERGSFSVYDSALSKRFWDVSLPVGNTTRTYGEMLRDWRFGKWQFWCWYTGRGGYRYIQVGTPVR